MKLASFYYFYGNTKYFFDFQEKSFNCIPAFCVIPYRTVSQFFCFFCRKCGGLLYFSTNLHHIHNLQVQFFIFKPSINSSKTWYHYDYLLIIKSLLELFINRCINFRCKTTSTFWLRRTPRTIPTFATISSIKFFPSCHAHLVIWLATLHFLCLSDRLIWSFYIPSFPLP